MRSVNSQIFSDRTRKITHLGDAPSAVGIVKYRKTGPGAPPRILRSGHITRRIGPSVPSPSLPARSFSVRVTLLRTLRLPADIEGRQRADQQSLLDRYSDVTFIL